MKMLSHLGGSNAGMTGALLGLALGLVEYFIAMMMMRRHVSREIAVAREANEPLPGLDSMPGAFRTLRIILIVTAVTIYPVAGYVVGALVAS